jgi:hypothetical protein
MSIEISPLLRRSLEDTTARLTPEFRGVFSPQTVERYVEKSFLALADRPTVGPNSGLGLLETLVPGGDVLAIARRGDTSR